MPANLRVTLSVVRLGRGVLWSKTGLAWQHLCCSQVGLHNALCYPVQDLHMKGMAGQALALCSFNITYLCWMNTTLWPYKCCIESNAKMGITFLLTDPGSSNYTWLEYFFVCTVAVVKWDARYELKAFGPDIFFFGGHHCATPSAYSVSSSHCSKNFISLKLKWNGYKSDLLGQYETIILSKLALDSCSH